MPADAGGAVVTASHGAVVTEFAPAKVNLTLHVTGRRSDGFHLLDSLVVFADVGDCITARPAAGLTLSVDGPRAAGVPTDDGNLVLKAARRLAGDEASRGAALTLIKVLPPASGIGGGSADAAATLRALTRLWNLPLPGPEEFLSLGADVPVCLAGRPVRMSGVGETLADVATLPALAAVLVNPGVAVSTPAVFAALSVRDNPPMADWPSRFGDAADVADWLRGQRNDLEEPALALAPPIGLALSALADLPGCLLARMSGSGATCFGLFADVPAAEAAAKALATAEPGWWVVPTRLG